MSVFRKCSICIFRFWCALISRTASISRIGNGQISKISSLNVNKQTTVLAIWLLLTNHQMYAKRPRNKNSGVSAYLPLHGQNIIVAFFIFSDLWELVDQLSQTYE